MKSLGDSTKARVCAYIGASGDQPLDAPDGMRRFWTALVFAAIVLAFGSSLEAAKTGWRFAPTNTNLASGISFTFENPTRLQATVTIIGKRGDEPFDITRTLNTDPRFDEHGFVDFDIRDLRTFSISRIRVQMGDRAVVVDNPKASQLYEF